MNTFEKILVNLDASPWDGLYRGVIGFAILPASSRVWGEAGWRLVPFVLGVLLMLKVVPAFLRKFLPLSETVRGAWAERRQLAKRWDSYQWRKLLWIGTGLAVYTLLTSQFSVSRIVVVSFCLISGAIGLARWRFVNSRLDYAAQLTRRMRNLAAEL